MDVDIIDNCMIKLFRRGVFSFAATEAVVQLVTPPPRSASLATSSCPKTQFLSRPKLPVTTCCATSANCASCDRWRSSATSSTRPRRFEASATSTMEWYEYFHAGSSPRRNGGRTQLRRSTHWRIPHPLPVIQTRLLCPSDCG